MIFADWKGRQTAFSSLATPALPASSPAGFASSEVTAAASSAGFPASAGSASDSVSVASTTASSSVAASSPHAPSAAIAARERAANAIFFIVINSICPDRTGSRNSLVRARRTERNRCRFRWPGCDLFFGPDEHGLAHEQEQEERSPGRQQRRITTKARHGERGIVDHEIGKAQRHADHRADEQVA